MSFAARYALGETRRFSDEKKLEALTLDIGETLQGWYAAPDIDPSEDKASYDAVIAQIISAGVDAFLQGKAGEEPRTFNALSAEGIRLYDHIAMQLGVRVPHDARPSPLRTQWSLIQRNNRRRTPRR